MSEYQYYEFQALDRPLTQREIDAVRGLSTRAHITPTSFTNEYHFGDFRGDPVDLVRRYYDLHVYYANWGSRRWLFRVPLSTVDTSQLEAYRARDIFDVKRSGEYCLIDIDLSPDDGGEYLDEDQDVAQWAADLSQLRHDVMTGDYRLLYLAWLLSVEIESIGDDEGGDDGATEPPVPAGLKHLSGPLETFRDLFGVDDDLLAAAAEGSPHLAEGGDTGLEAWIAALPREQTDRMLLDLCLGTRLALASELKAQFRKSQAQPAVKGGPRRTVAQLKSRAEELRAEREARAAALAQAKRQKQQRERQEHLRQVAAKSVQHWEEVERLVQTRMAANYTSAVKTVRDLRDAAALVGSRKDFTMRLKGLMERHRAKSSLMQLLRGLAAKGD